MARATVLKTMSYSRVDVLGVTVSPLTTDEALEEIERLIWTEGHSYVVFPNLFLVMEARRSPSYRSALNSARLSLADGTPVVWALRWLGHRAASRVCGPDIFELVNSRAEQRGYSVYLLGGAIESNAERVAHKLKTLHPNLRIAGTFSPPTGPIEGDLENRILADLSRVRPDILWVGLGSPMQERWLWRNREATGARVALAVGGTFNYYNGTRLRAPHWIRKAGLEWAHRIAQDPRLFWTKRFYAFPHEFLVPLAAQICRSLRKSGRRSAR
jgi:N-acetylglucosaminyldiphosphoundecaprenol N-acetyl-beta-D-mannosaminyltransferase